MIQEITHDMMDERAWMWTRVLAAINEPAIERALRLDLNTGVVTVMGPGRDERPIHAALRRPLLSRGRVAGSSPAGSTMQHGREEASS